MRERREGERQNSTGGRFQLKRGRALEADDDRRDDDEWVSRKQRETEIIRISTLILRLNVVSRCQVHTRQLLAYLPWRRNEAETKRSIVPSSTFSSSTSAFAAWCCATRLSVSVGSLTLPRDRTDRRERDWIEVGILHAYIARSCLPPSVARGGGSALSHTSWSAAVAPTTRRPRALLTSYKRAWQSSAWRSQRRRFSGREEEKGTTSRETATVVKQIFQKPKDWF